MIKVKSVAKMEKILFLIAAASVLGGVNSLQCYKCTNCTEVKSEQLVTCEANTTIITTTTTQKPNSTTIAPNTTITANNTTNATTTTPTPTTPTTTTTISTTVTVASNATNNSTSNITRENPETIRVRRSAEEERENNCFCNNDVCNCNGLQIVQFRDEKTTESYVCITDTLQVNGATVINRGCAVKQNQTQETCVSSAFSSNCTVCETDKCNGATAVSFSIFLLVLSLFTAVKIV